MKHVIIFGGTGMLAGATKWLAENAEHISIVGRNKYRLERLRPEHVKNNFELVTLDYRDNVALKEFLQRTIQTYGPVDLVVSWIHSVAPDALSIIFGELQQQKKPWQLVHIKGSSHDLSAITDEITVPKNCLYCDVQLGFKMEGSFSRWLTHEEISNGVISSIYYNKRKTVIGTLHPWSKRP
ncbi:short-chain dehydrogenase [Oceanobacillus sp. CFH 90083]|uniref:short-chain dehydrogenase n=1 Tax=Oceanobacillus sp. CFH 90083 TaxID=2592336 RepID=UPI00128C93F3|nr:short-chain dehydrogenase [Oceanobacillus sp. CFH 90083]